MEVQAVFKIDGDYKEIPFDAAPVMERLTEGQLLGVIDCGFGGDYEADLIAEESQDPEVIQGFEALNAIQRVALDNVGFECHVNREQFMEWIVENRPHLKNQLTGDMIDNLNECENQDRIQAWLKED